MIPRTTFLCFRHYNAFVRIDDSRAIAFSVTNKYNCRLGRTFLNRYLAFSASSSMLDHSVFIALKAPDGATNLADIRQAELPWALSLVTTPPEQQ